MKPFCEIIVSDVLPALRALIVKELIQTYNYNQSEVAKKLGITQPAISQYGRELRGHRVKSLESNKEIKEFVKKLASEIDSGSVKPKDIHCKFCDICKIIRENKILCQSHERIYSVISPCNFCVR